MRRNARLTLPGAIAVLVLCAFGLCLFEAKSARGLAQVGAAAENSRREQLNQLLKARYETGAKLLDMEEKRLSTGVTTLSHVCEVARWVRDSAVELPLPQAERLAALTNYVALTRRLDDSLARAADAGAAAVPDRDAAHYLRLDAEVTLLRAQGQ